MKLFTREFARLIAFVACWLFVSAMSVCAKDNSTEAALEAALKGNWDRVYKEASNYDDRRVGLVKDLLLGYASLHLRDWNQAWQHFSALDKSDQQESLLTWAEKLCNKNPKLAMAFLLKGDILARLDRYDDAIVALDRALEIDPKLMLAYDLQGLNWIISGSVEKAMGALDEALKLDSQRPHTLFERGMLDLISGDLEKAVQRLTTVLDNAPGFFLARNARGVAYTLQFKFEQALKDFDQVAQNNSEFEVARTNKSFAALLRAKDMFALEDIKRLAQITPKGVLGSLTMVIFDYNKIGPATQVASQSLRDRFGSTPFVTNNLNKAIRHAKLGDNVLYQRAVPSVASLPQVQPLKRNLDRFNDSVRLLYKITDQKMPMEFAGPLTFAGPLIMDLKSAKAGKFHCLTSHVLERTGKFGMQVLPHIVDNLKHTGALAKGYSLSPILAGLPDIAVGVGSQVGRRKLQPSIDEVTSYLDGINKACWATAGTLVGGPKAGATASLASGLAADILRGATMPIFQELANKPVRRDIVQQFRTLVDANIANGVPTKSFTETYGRNSLRDLMFKPKTLAELDNYAHWANSVINTGRLDSKIPTNGGLTSSLRNIGLHSNRSGVFLTMGGGAGMDVSIEETTDLGFLHGKKKTSSHITASPDKEPALSYPFLIFNAPSGATASAYGAEQ